MKHPHELDELLRQRLADLPATEPTGWDALERRLDRAADAPLRAALAGAAAGAPAAGWDALSDKLAPSAADAALADALNGLHPTPPAGGWDALTERMEEVQGEAVDAVLADRLRRVDPAAASGWAALAARLELIGHRRELIAAWKITEGALLASLLLLFVRFFPATAPTPVLAGHFPVVAERAAVLPPPAEPELVVTAPVVLTTAPAQSVKEQSAVRPRVTPKATFVAPAPLPIRNARRVNKLPARPTEQLTAPVVLPQPVLRLAAPVKSEPVATYANVFAAPVEINQITTNQNQAGKAFDIVEREHVVNGYSAGILVDFEQGRNTLQTGFITGRLRYAPSELRWIFADRADPTQELGGYTRFTYHTVSLPFTYKRTLAESTNWRFALRAGMHWRVITAAEFEGAEALESSFEYADNFRPPSNGRNYNPYRNRQTVDGGKAAVENPHQGWWQGGSILANSSLYLSGGFVAERLLSPRWSVYLSPTLGRVIYLKEDSGVGPYRDRINLVGLRMGGRYRFGK